MSHEAVDPRANVKVLLGTDGENFLSGPQILKKVLSVCNPCLPGVIKQHRLQMTQPQREAICGSRAISVHVAHKTRQAKYRATEAIEVDADNSKAIGQF